MHYYMSHNNGEKLWQDQRREGLAMVMVNTSGGTDDVTWNTLPHWMRAGIR